MSAKDNQIAPHDRFGLSKGYWDGLPPEHQALYALVRPLRVAAYKVDHHLNYLEKAIAELEKDAIGRGGSFELNPDFQRGHVWPEAKQVAYVENVFRGSAPMNIRFNCAGWNELSDEGFGDLRGADIVCVDGLQRLTALRRFMAGEISVFGGHTAQSLRGTPFDPARSRLSIEMFSIKTRAELLQFYLDINRGGVVHSDEEIERVEAMLSEAKSGRWEKPQLDVAAAAAVSAKKDPEPAIAPDAKKAPAKKTAKTRAPGR